MLGQQLEQREAMHGMVYDEMMKAILRIIHRLDLSSIKDSSTLQVMSGFRVTKKETVEKPNNGSRHDVIYVHCPSDMLANLVKRLVTCYTLSPPPN